jgi:hypothetical protein
MNVRRREEENEDRSVNNQHGPADGQVLRVYVAEHCGSCRESRRLAKLIARRLENLVVEVINIDIEYPADEIFAVPTYCYGGKILFLGNPREEELVARLLSLKQASRSSSTMGAGQRGSDEGFLDLGPAPVATPRPSHWRMLARENHLATACCGGLGIFGTLLCSLTMAAPAVGLVAVQTAHSSMEGMGSFDAAQQAQLPAWWTEVVHLGPAILVISVLLVALAVALRHPLAALPAIVGGPVLYVGMYAQPSLPVMYAATVLGISLLLLAYAVGLRPALCMTIARAKQ